MSLEMKLHVLETNEPMLNRKYQVHSNIRSGLMLKCSSGTKIENVQDSTQKKNLTRPRTTVQNSDVQVCIVREYNF